MGILDYFRLVAALAFVLGLIGILYLLARRYGAERFGLGAAALGTNRRLAVVEVRALTARHRLVLVRRDEVEHLLLLGPDRDLVVESGLPARTSFDRTLAATGEGSGT